MVLFARFTFLFSALLASTFSAAQSTAQLSTEGKTVEEQPAQIAATEEVEEILVVGEQPGPSLWKVYKSDHVLWVLGTISPLPKNIQWHSKQVESAVAESQEFLREPGVKIEVSFWGKVSLLPSLVGVKHNPDGKKLNDVLPENLYARWAALKEKYIGNDKDIEKDRPIFAATELFKKSIDKSGMAPSDSVRWAIEAIVRNNKIKTTRPMVEHPVKNPRSIVKKFKNSTLDDTECFAKTLERLETDLDAMRTRANAWAKGDMQVLRSLPYHDERQDCESAVLNSDLAQDQGLQNIKELLQNEWVAAAETSLANNTSTFAILPMSELFKSNGYLAVLAAKGYTVEAPE